MIRSLNPKGPTLLILCYAGWSSAGFSPETQLCRVIEHGSDIAEKPARRPNCSRFHFLSWPRC
jgi:hypothetical protein